MEKVRKIWLYTYKNNYFHVIKSYKDYELLVEFEILKDKISERFKDNDFKV
ncbi:MAG: hypothetical protein K8R68_10560 [Bacteroidales bacterium]|nr:hypothetical protein [Bacteroidales bacterium]